MDAAAREAGAGETDEGAVMIAKWSGTDLWCGERRRGTAAFTLIEILVALAVLTIIVVLASEMTSATLSTVSGASHGMESSEATRIATRMLRDELAGVLAVERRERYLNLRLIEDEQGVSLYFTVPRTQSTDLMRMGFVTHVVYVWEKKSRAFFRAEYHSSRDSDVVASTAHSVYGTNSLANGKRLSAITPSYEGGAPYAWNEDATLRERLKLARKNPLLTGVHDWKVECFLTNDLDSEQPKLNTWEKPGQLPVAIRFQWTIRNHRRGETGQEAIGRKYVSIVPVASVEAEP